MSLEAKIDFENLKLDMTDFVVESVKHADDSDKVPWVSKKTAAKKSGPTDKASKGA